MFVVAPSHMLQPGLLARVVSLPVVSRVCLKHLLVHASCIFICPTIPASLASSQQHTASRLASSRRHPHSLLFVPAGACRRWESISGTWRRSCTQLPPEICFVFQGRHPHVALQSPSPSSLQVKRQSLGCCVCSLRQQPCLHGRAGILALLEG